MKGIFSDLKRRRNGETEQGKSRDGVREMKGWKKKRERWEKNGKVEWRAWEKDGGMKH